MILSSLTLHFTTSMWSISHSNSILFFVFISRLFSDLNIPMSLFVSFMITSSVYPKNNIFLQLSIFSPSSLINYLHGHILLDSFISLSTFGFILLFPTCNFKPNKSITVLTSISPISNAIFYICSNLRGKISPNLSFLSLARPTIFLIL